MDGFTIPRVSIRHDRAHVIDIGGLFSLLGAQLPPSIPVFSIVELLRFEQPLHLIRDRVVRIVAEVGRYLVCAGKHRGARPARDIQDLLIGGLLGHLHGVNGPHCISISFRYPQPKDEEFVITHWCGRARP